MNQIFKLLMVSMLAFLCQLSAACKIDIGPADQVQAWKNLPPDQQASAAWVYKQNRKCFSTTYIANIVDKTYRFAQQNQLDPDLMLGMMRVESRFDAKAVSHANARGLMQVIPKWHREKIAGRKIHNPSVGIEVGVKVYREYLTRAKGNHYVAMNLYSGGGGRKYYRLVVKAKKEVQKAQYTQLFADGPTTVPVLLAMN